MSNKWTKWKFGVGGAIAVAALFNTVKTSPDFAQAHAAALNAKKTTASNQMSAQQDPVVDQWLLSDDGSTNNYGDDGGEWDWNNGDNSIQSQPPVFQDRHQRSFRSHTRTSRS